MNLFKLMCVFLMVGFFFTSCEKSRLNKDTTTANDNSTLENVFADLFKIIDDIGKNEIEIKKTSSSTLGACAVITITPAFPDTTFPKTATIDFGKEYCTGLDGRKRRGVVTAVFSGRYREDGTVITITPDNFHINNLLVEGEKTITNNGRNSDGNLSYTIVVQNGKVTYDNGDVATWKSTRIHEWIEGESTPPPPILHICDDVYEISGTASGINKLGRTFTVTIKEPLRKEICCRWIVAGVLEIQPQDLALRKVDFGDGTCDNKAIVTIKNKTFDISLH